ncbi:hypothetical protein [Parabacteroides sp. FAFU027]|nr:hypothetical protein [Parabacteroides sp. FAFU027]
MINSRLALKEIKDRINNATCRTIPQLQAARISSTIPIEFGNAALNSR